ncbi:MAG: PEP-CTERM sorting domain-containing protein [Terracidiphilus sp.]|jgi:hypothetical protein
MKKLSLALLALAMALVVVPAAHADTCAYSCAFVGSELDAVLTFTAVSNGLPDGSYTITHVAGTVSAGTDIPSPVSFSTDTLTDPIAPCGYDCGGTQIGNIVFNNQLFPSLTPSLDFYGVAFDVNGLIINIYSNDGIYQWTDSGSYQNDSNTNQPLSAAPEPSSLLMLGTALFCLAFVLYRRATRVYE